jgi:REP element-mobilizing transposase RayT
MSQSLSQVYVHAVFGTKHRAAVLGEDVRPRLFAYTATVLNNLDCVPVEVGGMADHVHILCTLSKNLSVAKFIEEVKKPTSKWLKTQDASLRDFHWQAGYGVFSVSPSNVNEVREYIMKQADHHKTRSFEDEFRQLLTAHGVEFDERYVWD